MEDDINNEFLGRGWNFPPSFEHQGRTVKMVNAEQDIKQSLEILLSTQMGERLMRPGFGWKRDALMFEPLSTTFSASLKNQIEVAILFFESRITLDNIRFEPSTKDNGIIDILLDYTIRTTNSRTNLVYPYYIAEASIV